MLVGGVERGEYRAGDVVAKLLLLGGEVGVLFADAGNEGHGGILDQFVREFTDDVLPKV